MLEASLCHNMGTATDLHLLTSRLSAHRVPTVLQVPKVWLVRGASWVFPDSVASEGSQACLAHL